MKNYVVKDTDYALVVDKDGRVTIYIPDEETKKGTSMFVSCISTTTLEWMGAIEEPGQ